MSEISIYEKAFAQSDKTDAVLVVDEKKLHVNRGLLSIHSDYFNTLFNSNFKEKSMEEIEFKDVKFEDFATLLSLVHPQPTPPTDKNIEELLVLADRFLLPCATHTLGLYLLSFDMGKIKKLQMADKYNLENVVDQAVKKFTKIEEMTLLPEFKNLSDKTKVKYFNRQLELSFAKAPVHQDERALHSNRRTVEYILPIRRPQF